MAFRLLIWPLYFYTTFGLFLKTLLSIYNHVTFHIPHMTLGLQHYILSLPYYNYIITSINDVARHIDTRDILMALVQVTTRQWWHGLHDEVAMSSCSSCCFVFNLHERFERSSLSLIFTLPGAKNKESSLWYSSSNFLRNHISLHLLIQWSTCLCHFTSVF